MPLDIGAWLACVELGFRVGLARRGTWKDADSGGGAIVQTSMFALLGLILAFTYASGASRLDARKQAIPAEANALGTAFHRAEFVAEPGRMTLKQTFLEYARSRVFTQEDLKSSNARRKAIAGTLQRQSMIWPAVRRVVAQENPVPVEVSLVAAVNAALDAHTLRLIAHLDTQPKIVMWMLLFVGAASLSVAGFNAGIQGRMSRWRMTALTQVLIGLMTSDH